MTDCRTLANGKPIYFHQKAGVNYCGGTEDPERSYPSTPFMKDLVKRAMKEESAAVELTNILHHPDPHLTHPSYPAFNGYLHGSYGKIHGITRKQIENRSEVMPTNPIRFENRESGIIVDEWLDDDRNPCGYIIRRLKGEDHQLIGYTNNHYEAMDLAETARQHPELVPVLPAETPARQIPTVTLANGFVYAIEHHKPPEINAKPTMTLTGLAQDGSLDEARTFIASWEETWRALHFSEFAAGFVKHSDKLPLQAPKKGTNTRPVRVVSILPVGKMMRSGTLTFPATADKNPQDVSDRAWIRARFIENQTGLELQIGVATAPPRTLTREGPELAVYSGIRIPLVRSVNMNQAPEELHVSGHKLGSLDFAL